MNDTFLDIKWSYIDRHSNTADFILHVRRKGKEDMKITHQPVRRQYRYVTIRHQFTDKLLRIKVIRRTTISNGYARYTSKYIRVSIFMTYPLGWMMVCCLCLEFFLQNFKCVSF